MNEPTQGQVCYYGSYEFRVKYDPEWSPSRPYCLYWRGCATIQFPTFGHVESYTGIKRQKWTEWK